MLRLLLLVLESLSAQPVVFSLDDVAEMTVHSLVVPPTRSHATSSIIDTEMVNEYVLIDPHMKDGVALFLHIDEY